MGRESRKEGGRKDERKKERVGERRKVIYQ